MGCQSFVWLWIDVLHPVSCHCSVCQIDHVRAERDVLAEVHNPYVVKLYYSFQVCHVHSSTQELIVQTWFATPPLMFESWQLASSEHVKVSAASDAC